MGSLIYCQLIYCHLVKSMEGPDLQFESKDGVSLVKTKILIYCMCCNSRYTEVI